MKITKESIEKIRNSLNLSDVVSMYIKVQKTGKRFKALCPFHNEKTPSFIIDDDKGLFHCFGCKASGDIFTFVEKIENCDFYEAAHKIASLANISVDYEKSSFEDEKPDLIKRVFAEVVDYYHNKLKSSKIAIEYLKKREIEDSIITKYKIGWASKDDLPFFNSITKKYKIDNDLLFQLGLLKKGENKVYPFFFERLIIPIQNHYQEYVALGGRTLNEEYGPKYLNSPEHQLFKKGYLLFNFANARIDKDNKKIIVVEGYFDALSLVQSNIPYVVAPLGTALTEYHLQILARKYSELYLLFDMDQAGYKATISSCENAIKYFSEINVVKLPSDIKDIDQFIKQKKIYGEELEKYIKDNSISGIDLLIKNKLYLNIEKRDINRSYKNFISFLNLLNDDLIASLLIKRAVMLDGVFSEDQILKMYNVKKEGKEISDNIIKGSEQNKKNNLNEIKKIEMDFVGFIISDEDFINISKQYIKPTSFFSKEASEFYQKALISLNYKDRNMFLRNELSEEESNYMYYSNLKEYEDKQSILEDYLSFFKLRDLENELQSVNKEIKKAEIEKQSLSELLEKKQFLVSSIQRLKEYRMKIKKKNEI